MVKFRIHSLGGRKVQIWESVKKCQNLLFFDIFCNILNKMKDNFCQECVKGGLYLSRANLKQLPLISLEKCFFPVLTLLLHLSLHKIWLSEPHKNYSFEMSDNRAIL